jgi:glycogen synthase
MNWRGIWCCGLAGRVFWTENWTVIIKGCEMKIALIEFEYPPDTATGGIAAYTFEAAQALTKRGHTVEVFAGAHERIGSFATAGVLVHRICRETRGFYLQAGEAFAARHREVHFDVLEGAELTAPARHAVCLVPDIPLVVRLHGPSFKMRSMSMPVMKVKDRLRKMAGALRRGHFPFWWKQKIDHIEREHARTADIIAATSKAVGEIATQRWKLDPHRVVVSPLPIFPDSSLLAIPAGGGSHTVTFIGHLGVGKGLLELIEAMAQIMPQNEKLRFQLVGRIGQSPEAGKDMRQYIGERLRAWAERVEVVGPITRQEMARIYQRTDILVLPSHWDTFPVVCLEAMAAGRAIVGARTGGIPEMLDEGGAAPAGVVVPPFKSAPLAEALLRLAADAPRREELGTKARQRLLTTYNLELSLEIMESCYHRAIAARNGRVRGETYAPSVAVVPD